MAFDVNSISSSVQRRLDRFLVRDDSTGCLNFTGHRLPKGYGLFGAGGRKAGSVLAHRAAFVLAGGKITKDKPFILHSCDNPACCEPSHLFAGTHAENVDDMRRKGRGHGSKSGLPFGVKRTPGGKYQSRYSGAGRKNLGTFSTWQEASAVAFLHKNLSLYPDLETN